MRRYFFVFVFIFSAYSFGVEPQKRQTKVILDHEIGEIRIINGSVESRAGAFDGKFSFDIRKGEHVDICLVNFNPLIYELKWKGITKTSTNNYLAIQEYIKTSKKAASYFIDRAEAEKTKNGESAFISGAVIKIDTQINQAKSRIDSLNKQVAEITSKNLEYENELKINETSKNQAKRLTGREAQVKVIEEKNADLADKINKNNKLIDERINQRNEVEKSLNKIKNNRESLLEEQVAKKAQIAKNKKKLEEILGKASDKYFRELADHLNDLIGISEQIPNWVKLSFNNKNQLKQVIVDKKIDETIKSVESALKAIDETELNILIKYSEWADNRELAERIKSISTILLLFHDQQPAITKLCEELRNFNANAKAIFENKTIGTVEYSPTEDIKAEFEITEVKEAKVENASKRPTGKFEYTFSPRSLFQISVGVVGAYSFVKTTDSDGKGNKLGWNVFPAITFIPRIWEDPALEFGFQLGASLKDSYPTFIFGISISVYENIFIGAGIHLQFFKDDVSKAGPYLALGWQPTKKK